MSDLPKTPAERVFNCAICGDLFVTFTTEAEANRELLESGIGTEEEDLHSVCDSCYEMAMKLARASGEIPPD